MPVVAAADHGGKVESPWVYYHYLLGVVVFIFVIQLLTRLKERTAPLTLLPMSTHDSNSGLSSGNSPNSDNYNSNSEKTPLRNSPPSPSHPRTTTTAATSHIARPPAALPFTPPQPLSISLISPFSTTTTTTQSFSPTSPGTSTTDNGAGASPETLFPRRRSYTKTTSAGTEINGEILVAEGWRRHTKVYGGGVCKACQESELRMSKVLGARGEKGDGGNGGGGGS